MVFFRSIHTLLAISATQLIEYTQCHDQSLHIMEYLHVHHKRGFCGGKINADICHAWLTPLLFLSDFLLLCLIGFDRKHVRKSYILRKKYFDQRWYERNAFRGKSVIDSLTPPSLPAYEKRIFAGKRCTISVWVE